MKRVALLLLCGLLTVTVLHAQAQGRIAGKIMDPDGNPLEGVHVVLSAIGFDITIEQTTKKKGKFSMTVVDSTKDYMITLEKEGYRTQTEPVNIPLQGIASKDFTMVPGDAGGQAAAPVESEAQSKSRAANVAFNDGVKAYNITDFDTAATKFEEAVAIDPTMSQAWAILSDLYLDKGDATAALDAADQALAAEAGNLKALTSRFDALHTLDRREEALTALDALMAVDSSTATAARVYNAAAAAARADDNETALALFEKSVEIDPQLGVAHRVLADSYFKAGNLETAKLHSDQLFSIDPENPAALQLRYEIYHALGDDEIAGAALDALEQADPAALAETYLVQGVEMFEGGDTAGAIDLLERAVAANPDQPRVNYRLGMAYASSGQNDKAKQHLQRFIDLAPDDPEAATAAEMIKYL